jgi:C4-dicarboxylate transporter DctM subunit
MMAIGVLLVFILLLALGVPVGFAVGSAGTAGLLANSGGADLLPIVPQQLFGSLNSFPLLAVPLFILAGTIMAHGGVATRIVDLAESTVGRGRGGLGAAMVLAAMVFHGISGSSTADTAAIGKVVIPELKAKGYPIPFGTALLAAAGGTALLVPPTIDLIIVGTVASISIAGLFAGALVPASVNALALIALAVFIAHRRGYGGLSQPVNLAELAWVFVKAVPGLVMVAIILGGILLGVFTPAEAAAVAAVYGLFVSMVVYRDLKMHMLPSVFRGAIELTGGVLLVASMGNVLGYAMAISRVPEQLALAIQSMAHDRYVFLLLVQLLFFAVGMIMDGVPAEIILMPILTPIAVSYGVHPIHFGIMVVANVALGLAIPPVGLCFYTACAVAELPAERVVKPLLPFAAILVVTLLAVTYVGGLALVLPTLLQLG